MRLIKYIKASTLGKDYASPPAPSYPHLSTPTHELSTAYPPPKLALTPCPAEAYGFLSTKYGCYNNNNSYIRGCDVQEMGTTCGKLLSEGEKFFGREAKISWTCSIRRKNFKVSSGGKNLSKRIGPKNLRRVFGEAHRPKHPGRSTSAEAADLRRSRYGEASFKCV